MKRIIYTAVALIICASVFGIADYYSAKKQGALVNYTDDEQTTETVAEKKTETAVVKEPVLATPKKEIKKELKVTKKNTKAAAKETHDTGVPGEVVSNDVVITEKTKEPVPEKVDPVTTLLQSKTTDDDPAVKEEKEEKRTIKMEMFSRAPIRNKKMLSKK